MTGGASPEDDETGAERDGYPPGTGPEAPWATDDPAWPVHDSEVVWETPFFSAGQDVVERPAGERADYYWLDPADAVTILAVESGDLLFVEQYRPRHRASTLELPTGGVDPDERPATAAKRELAEETGFRAAEVTHLESYVPSGWLRYHRHVYLAEGLTSGETALEDGEAITTVRVPTDEALARARGADPVMENALTPILLARAAGLL